MFTIVPLPAFWISGAAAWITRKVPVKFTATVRENTSAVVSAIPVSAKTPAALMTPSSPPIASAASLAAALTDDGSDTSQAIATAPISSATAFAALSDRSRIATAAPSRRNSRAVARPIPDAPPVMMILRPASRAIVFSCSIWSGLFAVYGQSDRGWPTYPGGGVFHSDAIADKVTEGWPVMSRWGVTLALNPGQAVLDPGRRPGTPRHGEELEPLLNEEVRVHPGRDEIHRGGDAVLRGGRRDFIERSLIDVALVVERYPQLDRKIGRADQQDVDARDRGDGIEVLQRLVRLDHRHDNELVVHGIEVIAVILELAPLAAHPGVAAVAEGKIAAGAHGGLRLLSGVDHRHNDASRPGVKREADLIGLVRGDAHQRRGLVAAHCLDRRLQLLDLPGGVLGIEQQEVVPGVGQDRHVNVRRHGGPDDGST